MSTHPAGYAPCPQCGDESLAAMVDHICQDCEDLYRLCLKCQPDYPFTHNDGTGATK